MIRSCKSSMYLSARHMVSKGPIAKITELIVIYAFVPHFCRHERAQTCYQIRLDTLRDLEDPPEHSLESHNCRIVHVSCNCCRRHLPSDGHHLCVVNHKIIQATHRCLHLTLRERRILSQHRNFQNLPGARTSSCSASVACLQGLALDKCVRGGRHQGAKFYANDRSRSISIYSRDEVYIRSPLPDKCNRGFAPRFRDPSRDPGNCLVIAWARRSAAAMRWIQRCDHSEQRQSQCRDRGTTAARQLYKAAKFMWDWAKVK